MCCSDGGCSANQTCDIKSGPLYCIFWPKNDNRKLHTVHFCLYVLFRLHPVICSSSQALIILIQCLVNTVLLLSKLDLCTLNLHGCCCEFSMCFPVVFRLFSLSEVEATRMPMATRWLNHVGVFRFT